MRLKRLSVYMFILSLLSISFVSFLFVTRLKLLDTSVVEYDEQGDGGEVIKTAISSSSFDHRKAEEGEEEGKKRVNVPPKLLKTGADQQLQQQIPVLVIAANRPNAIENHLRQLTRLRPSPVHFPIIVSQDGDNAAVTAAISKFVQQEVGTVRLIHHQQSSTATKTDPYYRISQHYKFALSKVFLEMGFDVAIVTEDDLDIADDFFSYFSSLRYLLDADPTIWCISAWNDNGNPAIIDWRDGQHKLWRTDFFPGLGWMLKAETWRELVGKWPEMYWDDWFRRPDVRLNRVCIRPEQSRTLHNLQVAGRGSSGALFKGFLASIRLPKNRVNFGNINLDFLLKHNFDKWLWTVLNASVEFPLQILLQTSAVNLSVLLDHTGEQRRSLRVVYKDPREFRQIAEKFSLMADTRSGMPRTAYYGVVPFYYQGIQLFAVHAALPLTADFNTWNGTNIYATEWDLKSKFLDFAEIFCVPKRWTGNCNPYNPKMREWFVAKGWTKRLDSWLPVIVF